MRFTITNSTVLTGPITLTTRFAGVVVTPNNQLGFRFLGYQGPLTVAGGTPPLAVSNFLSSTSGVVPNITTILTWTFDTITNTSGNSYVYELPYQIRFVGDGILDTGNNATIQGSQTYITWAPYTASDKKTANNVTVDLRKPNLSAPYSTKTASALPGVQGGATVAYTITLKNGDNTTNFIPAWELVVTDSLDSRLTYVGASPVPSGVLSVPGQNTIITWTAPNWTLAPNTTWVARVTATLPSTFAANTFYTNTVTPSYTSLPGTVPDEFEFMSIVSTTVKGGIIGTKQASPSNNVRIGDSVTYTIRITVNPGIYLNTPIFTDTLPRGFHYRPGTFSFSSPDLNLNGVPITTVLGLNEGLVWALNNVPAGGSHSATITYVAGVTGVNTDSSLAYIAQGELSGGANAINAVQASWQDDTGTRLALLAPWNSTTRIVQPYLANPNPATNFTVTIDSWQPFTAPLEVGSIARYNLSVRNTGPITAYEVVLSDLLPDGVSYQGVPGISPVNLQLLQVPTVGAVGTIQFIVNQLPPNTTVFVTFNALVGNTARPGDLLLNRLSLTEYSSQPGGKYDGNGNDNDFTGVHDRQYGGIAAAIPAPKVLSFTLKGLTAVKTDVPDPVLPGQVMTYFIAYSNTSAVYAANNVQIVDTYDPLLTFNTANPAPSSHNVGAHTLTWSPGTLSTNSGNRYITATFTVATGISRTVRTLTNTITSDSAAPAPAMSRLVTTTLVQPKPTINLDDKGVSVKANDLMTYTMVYSNASAATGATTGTFSITLDYAPYASFITYTATPVNPPGPRLIAGSNGTIFTDTLGPGISRTVQLRMQVARPLPYNLTSFTSTATIYQPAVDISDSESEQTPVVLPVYQLVKTQTTPGNPPVSANSSLAYAIHVTNTGPVTGTNIVITDVWDLNTWNHQPASNWTLYGTYGVYTTIASLPPGAGVALNTLNMNVTTTLPANVQLIRNVVQLTSRETTQQQTIFDTPIVGLYIQKSHTPDPVFPGEVLTYTIAYTLYGIPATSPRITDTLPAGVTYLSCYTTVDPSYPSTCTPSSGKVVWSWSTLPAGYSGTITAVVQAPNTEWITLTNTYASNSVSGAPYREGPPDYTYVGRPHLSISKRASTVVTPPAPGDLVIYTLTYTNAGSYKATNAMAHDTVPVNTTFFSCSGAPCSESAGIVNWSLGEVPITTTRTVTLVVRVNPTAGTTTIVNNVYSLSADRNVFNENTPPAVNTSVVRPALSVVKSVAPSWIALNGTVTYTVRYTNTGGGTFTTLRFTDTVDSRLSVLGTSGNCTTVLNVVTCTDANLAPNQSRQFTITVHEASLSNNDVTANFARYLAANQTEVLPEGQSNTIEVPASSAGAAANFVGTPTSGSFPLNVTFTNLSSAASGVTINSCSWNFGDNFTSASACQPGNQVNHTYNQAGVYTVALTINTNFGIGTNTRTRVAYITVGGAATFGVSIASPQPNKSGARGTQVVYTLRITNTGTIPDSFTLSAPPAGSYQWPTQIAPGSTGTLPAQGAATAQVTVSIPSAAPLVASDVFTVTATSNGSSSVHNSVTLRTSTLIYPIYLPLIKK
jgi:uncharacterized repeat protein (TIGR01451 family)/fimbrial isopeptide formation D2 family protein